MITRRRLLLTASAAACAGATAPETAVWHGTALGADARMTIAGPGAKDVLTEVLSGIARDEALVSLYRPDSTLSRLNATGRIDAPPPDFTALLRLAFVVHRRTGGTFDPTVQPLWRALAEGRDTAEAEIARGFERVGITQEGVTLDTGQGLTLNGIAQGWITDRAIETLAARGFAHALVDLGEARGIGGPHRLSLVDPAFGRLGTRTINGTAIATSSPRALVLPKGQPHILGGEAMWSTVSVTARTAAVADALSTAFCLMPERDIRAVLKSAPDVLSTTLVSEDGRLKTLANPA